MFLIIIIVLVAILVIFFFFARGKRNVTVEESDELVKETKRLSQINSEVDKKNKERKEAIDKTQARIDEFMLKTIKNIDRQRKQIKWSDDIENLNATKK